MNKGHETDVSWNPEDSLSPILEYWKHLYGASRGYLNIFSGPRPSGEKGKVNKGRLTEVRDNYFRWPEEAEKAARYVLDESQRGRNVYCCAHLLTTKDRVKENATQVWCLWAD